MATMTKRERVRAALAGEAVDRLPRYLVPGSFTTEAVVAIGEAKNALDASMRG